MRLFEGYVQELEASARAALRGDEEFLRSVDFPAILNGAVGTALREFVSLEDLQEKGAFFTGTDLRARALGPLLKSDLTKRVAWDPACGAGDLLLSFAERLPVSDGLEATLAAWERQLLGGDIEPVFLRAARARLVLAAYHRGVRPQSPSSLALEATFKGLRTQDSFNQECDFPPVDYVVLNPPFVYVQAPEACKWARGRISAAALLTERCMRNVAAGTSMVAILPDVLRSGARYEEWRTLMERHADIVRVDLYGSFDPQADVDVFIVEMVKRQAPHDAGSVIDSLWQSSMVAPRTFSDFCSVSVGAVVPHRHIEDGPDHRYLHTSDATPWGTLTEIPTRRRFKGTTIAPPFVAVRRTSSPSDNDRPIGTIVLGEERVAVENHLIVLKPKNPTAAACQLILDALRSPSTRVWLDQRIRCRHLTVGSIKAIPWPLEIPEPESLETVDG